MPVTSGINLVSKSEPPLTAKLTEVMPGAASASASGVCPSIVPTGFGERV